MPLRVPYRLLRRSEPAPAAAVLLTTEDPAVLLAVCARLVDPLVFPVAGGFLVVADSVPVAVPHAIRLRRLCENGFLPVDAELTPALLPAEAVDLTARRGLVFLPGRTPLTFDSSQPLKPAAFLHVSKPRRQDWQPFPAGNPPAEWLTTIIRILPEAPDDLLASDGSPIGTDTLRPPQVGPGRRALGRVSAGLGKGLKGLGKAIGSSKLGNLGGKLTGLAAALAPRLTEDLLGKQEAALQQLLKKFREGSTDDALRHAVPVGEPGRGSQIHPSDRLPTNNLFWSLTGLFSRGISSIWAGGNPETWRELIAEYRRAAQAAADRGDFRRAALIYARLLGDFRAAAETLSRGGLHRQAAIIYRDKVRQNDRAAHEFEKAGENDEALRLYRESHLYLDAGDLLRRLGEDELAIAEYHRAAERVISLRSDFVEAGDILLKKTGRADMAIPYFERGWDARSQSLAGAGNALPCAERLIEIHALAESRDLFWRLLGEAEDWLREPGWALDTARFFNRVVECAELPGFQSERMEIRDRCRVGLAGKLREHVKADTTAGTAVADLFGQSKRWSPAVVSDADFALRAALKTRPKIERPAHRGIRVIHLWTGATTAALQATDTGELFVGFQEGAVVQYDPASGVSRPIYLDSGFPVLGLATDSAGEAVVALRVDGRQSPAERLKKYALEFAERHGTVLTPRTRTTWSQEPETLLGLLPVLDNYGPSRTVLVSTANGIGCYRLPDLIVQDETSPRTPLPPTTHLKLRIPGYGGESTLTFQGGSVSWDGGRVFVRWMPDPAPGSTLYTPPTAWLIASPRHVELAGLSDNATLYWAVVTRQGGRRLSRRTGTYLAPGGFRAMAIWRPGQIVGVTATNRVLWLKDRVGRLEEWALAVDLSTPSLAVACFPSRATNEVLVVLEGGHLARVPGSELKPEGRYTTPMRRSIVRLIAARETRDLLRDRRTLLIILVLPALLYPAFVVVGLAFAVSMMDQKTIIGVAGAEHLPAAKTHPEALLAGGALAVEAERRWDDPPLLVDGQFAPKYLKSEIASGPMVVRLLPSADESPLQSREVDAIVVIPPDIMNAIASGKKPEVRILGRDGDETSKLAVIRVGAVIERWRERVKEVRFARRGLPADFDQPVAIIDPDHAKPPETRTADELRDVLVKFLPFLLVMWTMAGALHPAIDLTAGEKERGTMETLLICPAGRTEIVAGKFLAVFVFSYTSALWNLLWMAAGALLLGVLLPSPILSFAGLGWSALLAAPLAALFSSLALGLGAFARSTKEGQYYLLPLMLLTLPLSMFALTPGLKLTPLLSAVPVSGLTLILQNLLAVSGEPVSVWSWLLGVGSLVGCVALALAWAAWQFRREEVLFRAEEGLSLGAWWRMMTRRDESSGGGP